MAIQLAVGAPQTMLEQLCVLGDAELCFAHLMRHGDSAYARYYRQARDRERLVILDNGIMELGYAQGSDLLLEIVGYLRPQLVTPPEVLHNGEATLRLATDFGNRLTSADGSVTSILGVAHGSSFDEWRQCFEALAQLPRVARIGIPYDLPFDVVTPSSPTANRLETLVRRRIEICQWIAANYPTIDIHLFGLAHPSELPHQAQHAFVKSIDTSLPVTAAVIGITYGLREFGPFAKRLLEMSLPYDEQIVARAQHNIVVMKQWLEGAGAEWQLA